MSGKRIKVKQDGMFTKLSATDADSIKTLFREIPLTSADRVNQYLRGAIKYNDPAQREMAEDLLKRLQDAPESVHEGIGQALNLVEHHYTQIGKAWNPVVKKGQKAADSQRAATEKAAKTRRSRSKAPKIREMKKAGEKVAVIAMELQVSERHVKRVIANEEGARKR